MNLHSFIHEHLKCFVSAILGSGSRELFATSLSGDSDASVTGYRTTDLVKDQMGSPEENNTLIIDRACILCIILRTFPGHQGVSV